MLAGSWPRGCESERLRNLDRDATPVRSGGSVLCSERRATRDERKERPQRASQRTWLTAATASHVDKQDTICLLPSHLPHSHNNQTSVVFCRGLAVLTLSVSGTNKSWWTPPSFDVRKILHFSQLFFWEWRANFAYTVFASIYVRNFV